MATPGVDRPFERGELLAGRFRIVREAGRGGMGVVWEAIDEKLDRRVALKTARAGHGYGLPPEARAAREVSHFNVCKVYDVHTVPTESGELEFLSMEFVAGETLAHRIRAEGPLEPPEAREIALQICAGLAQAHRQGVIHGDLKCGNVILAQAPEGGARAVITDFGLATLAPETGEEDAGRHGGTHDYMAPELFAGASTTVASDLYALGVMLHEMLTGSTPPWGERPPRIPQEASTVTAKIERPGPETVRRRAALPAPWNGVVARCLAPAPGERFATADEVAEELRPRGSRRRWALATAPVLCAGLLFALWPAREEAAPAVRLAVLPPVVEGNPVPTAAGVALDVADRLGGLRRGFVVIPPTEAARYQVSSPEAARAALTATHVLRTTLNSRAGRITASAAVIDTATGAALENFRGSYAEEEAPLLAKALAATVTGAFHLRQGVPVESVAAPAYAAYVQGIGFLRKDQAGADQAIPFFEEAMRADGRSALPHAGLAEAQLQKFERGYGGEWLAAASQSVARAQSLNPDSAPVLLAAGRLEEARGQYEQAARRFQRAAELAPDNADAWNRLAAVYGNMNRPEDAVATFRKAVDAQPNYYAPRVEFGRFYFLRGQYKEAEELFRRVTQIAPELPVGHMNLGLALKEQGRFREAEEALLQSMRLQVTTQVLTNLGALYYQQERYAEAARFFEQIQQAAPANAIRYMDLGDAYRHLGRLHESGEFYRKARAMAEGALTQNPRDARTRAWLAFLSARLNDPRRAEVEVTQALSMAPDNATVMQEAALTFEALGERDKTLEALANAPQRVLEDLSRQPDVKDLGKDPRFLKMLENKIDQK